MNNCLLLFSNDNNGTSNKRTQLKKRTSKNSYISGNTVIKRSLKFNGFELQELYKKYRNW